MAATAKVITLKGDPKNPESAEHIIIFPGGSISVCRTSDNNYWAHITVYTPSKGPAWHEQGTMEQRHGKIESIRIDTLNGVQDIQQPGADHFAVLISTNGPELYYQEKLKDNQLSLL